MAYLRHDVGGLAIAAVARLTDGARLRPLAARIIVLALAGVGGLTLTGVALATVVPAVIGRVSERTAVAMAAVAAAGVMAPVAGWLYARRNGGDRGFVRGPHLDPSSNGIVRSGVGSQPAPHASG
jgi:hypothetical protein